VAIPLPCASVCRLDIILNEHKFENTKSHIVKWTGVLPSKLPTLLTKIEKSLDNEKLGNSVLKAHFATLLEEWAKYEFIYNYAENVLIIIIVIYMYIVSKLYICSYIEFIYL